MKKNLIVAAIASMLVPGPAFSVDELVMPPSTQFEVNGGARMKDRSGYSTRRVTSTAESPTPNGTDGAFRIECRTTHMRFDDPIVYPGQERRSHLHVFFGHVGVQYNTDVTANALALTGTSSCAGGTMNRSGYWVPAMINTVTGFPVTPINNIVYYKTSTYYRDTHGAEITTPVAGLRMVAGNPSNTSEVYSNYRWDCIAAGGGIVSTYSIPGAACANGSDLVLLVFFPNCWDGVNLDSSNHQNHMAYPSPVTGCPGTHPVPIVNISFNIHYKVNAQNRPENWRLSSDTYSLAIPAGRSAHGDWINGWNQTDLQTITDNCVRAMVDCHAHLMGDGNMIY